MPRSWPTAPADAEHRRGADPLAERDRFVDAVNGRIGRDLVIEDVVDLVRGKRLDDVIPRAGGLVGAAPAHHENVLDPLVGQRLADAVHPRDRADAQITRRTRDDRLHFVDVDVFSHMIFFPLPPLINVIEFT